MRKQLLSVFLPLLIVSLMMAADTQTNGASATVQAASRNASLKRVDVVRGKDGISIEITAIGQVTPKLSTLERPARLLLDLPNTVAETSQRHIVVNSEGVDSVRVGMDGQVPPTTRVVVDLEKAVAYNLVPGTDKLTLVLHTGSADAKAASPAPQPASPIEEKKSALSRRRANDFVVVEPPSSKPAAAKSKPDTSKPPTRVLEAVAKFAGKPAEALLPSPSASLQTSAPQPQPAPAQAASAQQSSDRVPQPAAAAAPTAPVAPTVEEVPPSPPQVTYKDGQLSIQTLNSTLGDILKAIRSVMGADIDIPPKASRERMAANLGPGPAREVLSSLLSWTDYNYLIQASDTDPNGIQSVLLTPRPKGGALTASGPASSQAPSTWARRLAQAPPSLRQEAQNDSLPEESPQTSTELGSPQNASGSTQPAGTQHPTTAVGGTSASNSPSVTDDQAAQPEVAAAVNSDPAPDQAGKNSERMMQLQNLYEQRKQMMEEARKPPTQN